MHFKRERRIFMKKEDWLLFISGLLIVLYCWIVMGYSIANVFSSSTTKVWIGSFWSIVFGLIFLLVWGIFAVLRIFFCGKEAYKSLRPGEKKICQRYFKNVIYELWEMANRRKDKVGKTAHFFTRILSRN